MKVLKTVVMYLNLLRFWPHFLCYFISKNRNLINIDLASYGKFYKVSGRNTFLLLHFLFYNHSYRSYFYYRIGEITKLYEWLAPGSHDLYLPQSTKFGVGILFFHAYSTIIGAHCVGDYCEITQNVTVGFKNGLKPRIGNNVKIFPNAVISGDLEIGDNCIIGPGCVVYKSIPANCVVVGNPAIILKQDGVVVNKKL